MSSPSEIFYGRFIAMLYEFEASGQDCSPPTIRLFYYNRYGEETDYSKYLCRSANLGSRDRLMKRSSVFDQVFFPARGGERLEYPDGETLYGRVVAGVCDTYARERRGADLEDLKAFSEATDEDSVLTKLSEAIKDKVVIEVNETFLPAYANAEPLFDTVANTEMSLLSEINPSEIVYGRVIAMIYEMHALDLDCIPIGNEGIRFFNNTAPVFKKSMGPFYESIYDQNPNYQLYIYSCINRGLDDGLVEHDRYTLFPARVPNVGRNTCVNFSEVLYGRVIAAVYIIYAREERLVEFAEVKAFAEATDDQALDKLSVAIRDELVVEAEAKRVFFPTYAAPESFRHKSDTNHTVSRSCGVKHVETNRVQRSRSSANRAGFTTPKKGQVGFDGCSRLGSHTNFHCGLESRCQTDDGDLPAGVIDGTTGHSPNALFSHGIMGKTVRVDFKGGATGHSPKVQFLQQLVEKTGNVEKNPCRRDKKAVGSVKSDESVRILRNHQGFCDGGLKGRRLDFETFEPCDRKNCGADLRVVEEVNVEVASPHPKVASVRKIRVEEGFGKMPEVLQGRGETWEDRECPGGSAREKAREADGQNRERSEHACKGCVVINVNPGACVNMHFHN